MLVTTRTWLMALVLAIVSVLVGFAPEAGAQGAPPPGAADAAHADVAPAPPPRLELLGVVIRGDVRRALVREPVLTEGRARWVEVGGQLGDYTVVAGERARVVLDNDGDSLAVRLAGPPPPRPAMAPTTTRPPMPGTATTPAARTPARRPAPVAEFLAWRTGASVEEMETRIRAGRSWLSVAQEYGLEPGETLREYRAWRTRR